MSAEEALWDDQNHMLTYVHWIILWITYVLTSEIASSWTWACCFWMFLVDSLTEWLYFQIFCRIYASVKRSVVLLVDDIGGFLFCMTEVYSIQVFHFVWTYMLAEEALWDDQNHMLTYVHWIILWITSVLTSEIASSWTWALLFLDVFGWFFDRVIVLSNLLPYSCIREEISCVVGGRDWRVSLLHDWSRQVFHFAWTYIHVSKGSTLGWSKSHANLCPLNLLVDYIRPNIWNCLGFSVNNCDVVHDRHFSVVVCIKVSALLVPGALKVPQVLQVIVQTCCEKLGGRGVTLRCSELNSSALFMSWGLECFFQQNCVI